MLAKMLSVTERTFFCYSALTMTGFDFVLYSFLRQEDETIYETGIGEDFKAL